MLRASKCGQKLEVVSVCNEHNHEISENISKKLPHNRKLPPVMKAEILEMLCLQIDRKKLIEYIKLKTNKQLTQKDLFNLAASHKYPKTAVNNERANILLDKIQSESGFIVLWFCLSTQFYFSFFRVYKREQSSDNR